MSMLLLVQKMQMFAVAKKLLLRLGRAAHFWIADENGELIESMTTTDISAGKNEADGKSAVKIPGAAEIGEKKEGEVDKTDIKEDKKDKNDPKAEQKRSSLCDEPLTDVEVMHSTARQGTAPHAHSHACGCDAPCVHMFTRADMFLWHMHATIHCANAALHNGYTFKYAPMCVEDKHATTRTCVCTCSCACAHECLHTCVHMQWDAHIHYRLSGH